MKKFLIEPFMFQKLSNESLEHIQSNLSEGNSERKVIKEARKKIKVKCANYFIAVEPSSGNAYSFIPLIHENAFYHSKFPNPIHLYFNQAFKNFQLSKSLFSNITFKRSSNSNLYMIEESLFNSYLESKISTIIFLHSTLEAFINYTIPENFIYRYENKEGVIFNFSKADIVRKVNIKEKLMSVLPGFTSIDLKSPDKKKYYDSLLEIISVRDELIHLKIKKMDNNLDYNGAIESIVNLKMDFFLESVVEVINFIMPGFLKFQDINSNYFRFKFEDYKAFKTDISFFLKIIQSNYNRISIEIPYSKEKTFLHMKDWVMQNLEVLREYNYIESIDSQIVESEVCIIIVNKNSLSA